MKSREQPRPEDVAIIGASSILPGASSLEAFWQVLDGGKNVLAERPEGRWSVERFLRPGEPAPGFSYTFAGGYLEDPFGFDPSVFSISPREAQQMDPQQRLLLMATWRAIEDAGLRPSSLAGRRVGVYVGASLADYQSVGAFDPAVIGSHFMTGNALSILANRVSYVFDLKGPSFAADAACSSSFVALVQAVNALREGEVELAIVGGVNMLLSPVPFIGFSQARMLSPTGLCRPFAEAADGYVRSEGAVVMLLQRTSEASALGRRIRSVIVAARCNSDGRTNGISMPSREAQQELIEETFQEAALHPEQLAFIEAHGTGTPIGDPIEAAAIGGALGRRRSDPLPIGSVKSNIGHLEAASGLASLIKTSLALEHRVLPRSLFCEAPNPTIPFHEFNLAPVSEPLSLPGEGTTLFASVCNYGFGGANGHVILRSAPERQQEDVAVSLPPRASVLLISAASESSLQSRCRQFADVVAAGRPVEQLANALAHQCDAMPNRVAFPISSGPMVNDAAAKALRAFGQHGKTQHGETTALVHTSDREPIFVFSGNGAQNAGMGTAAYRCNPDFRAEIDAIDAVYAAVAGWSIADLFRRGVTEEEIKQTSIAQPLIFATQSALAAVLSRYGIRAAGVIGHSVGEIAAAECAGLLSRESALRILHTRSRHQEAVRGRGRMLVLAADAATTADLLHEIDAGGSGIAAYNSANSTTVSGPSEELERLSKFARRRRVASVALQLDYPFHSSALDGVREPLLADLGKNAANEPTIPFFSTVTGSLLAAHEMTAEYWWRNIRDPVAFMQAVEAASLGRPNAAFLEISPRPVLAGALGDIGKALGNQCAVLWTLSGSEISETDPIRIIVARLAANGVRHDRDAIFGAAPRRVEPTPPYPFQLEPFRFEGTSEAISSQGHLIESQPLHPLLGARVLDGSTEWRNLIDPVLVPYLADHCVDGRAVMPASGLIEMALAAGRACFGDVPLEIAEFDIAKVLAFNAKETREISTRYVASRNAIDIRSRRRFSGGDWTLHAQGSLLAMQEEPVPSPADLAVPNNPVANTSAEVYAAAAEAGLDYGSCFRVVTSIRRDEMVGESQLSPPEGGTGAFDDFHILHPVSLDASFHGLFLARPQRDGEQKAHLPIRFRRIRVWRQGARITRSVTQLERETARFKTLSVNLLDEAGNIAASIEAAVLRSVHLVKPFMGERMFRIDRVPIHALSLATPVISPPDGVSAGSIEADPLALTLKAFSISLAHRLCTKLSDGLGSASLESLVVRGKVPESGQDLFSMAREVLAGAGALQEHEGETHLAEEFRIPSPEVLLATLMQRFPAANRELRIASRALSFAEPLLLSDAAGLRGGAFNPDHWSLLSFSASAQAVTASAIEAWTSTADRPVRVLVTGDWNSGVMDALVGAVRQGRAHVTLAATDTAAAGVKRLWAGVGSLFDLLVLDDAQHLSPPRFDALIDFSLPLAPGHAKQLEALGNALERLAHDAPILVVEPAVDSYLAFLLCAATPEIAQNTHHDVRQGLRLAERTMKACGATAIAGSMSPDALLHLLTARTAAHLGTERHAHIAVVSDMTVDYANRLYAIPSATIFSLGERASLQEWLNLVPSGEQAAVFLADEYADGSSIDRLTRRIGVLADVLRTFATAARSVSLFVMTHESRRDAEKAGEEAGLHAFTRVAVNEYPGIDLRIVQISSSSPANLVDLIHLSHSHRELRLGEKGVEVIRVRRGLKPEVALKSDERAVLQFTEGVGVDGFVWNRHPRETPSIGEVEVEVVAASLNYRDVLVGLGLLDDDLLGAGLTRGALGFECAGRISRIGPGVTRFRVGDPVMGFAAGTFASHVRCPDWHFFQVPDGIDLEAAATIPVAFATAWYALMERGRLKANEEVLIHGAAGSVGLAAIQIAKSRGARVIGTASSDPRRALASAAGADEVFDSRHERFASSIRQRHGGVDVVLNSLAGSGMLASFQLLRPFGRFLELGKRDFLDNSHLTLRPFLRNITYSGVDLDELLAADPDLVHEMMEKLAEAFRAKALRPLTYRSFAAHEVSAAFRTMQASEHIGKIVIRPPQAARRNLAAVTFSARPGLYLIIGGTTGFGFETADWLSRKGASTIALLSRRGEVDADLLQRVAAIRRRGVQLIVKQLDVCDASAVSRVVEDLTQEQGPLRGVIHAAAQLDDGLIESLSPERVKGVLRAKVDGLINLSRAVDCHALDFFVAYSSATTLIGSPGQGAYVAANGFVEGFMRNRRERGQPGLAIGWGAISDAGMIARNKDLGERLRRATGVVPMRSFEALAQLGRLLALGSAVDPVQYFAGVSANAGAARLSLLKSADFIDLWQTDGETSATQTTTQELDLSGKSRNEAMEIVIGVLRREIAEILRMPPANVDADRPLADLGFDSLMALEFHMSIESLLGAQVAVVGTGERSMTDIAAAIVDQLDEGAETGPMPAQSLQSTIIKLADTHAKVKLSPEQADDVEAAVRNARRRDAQ